MDKLEAIKTLDQHITELKKSSYETFEQWLQKKQVQVFDVEGSAGNYYKIETQAVLEDSKKEKGNIRVISTIADNQLLSLTRSFPMFRQFIITPNNSIVAE
jgi:hypothetical protein